MAKDKVGGTNSFEAQDHEPQTAPELPDDQPQLSATDAGAEPSVSSTDNAAEPLEPPAQKTLRPAVLPPVVPKRTLLSRLKLWLLNHKKTSAMLVLLALLGVLAAIPFTRYSLAGLVLKQQFTVSVADAETRQPVTSARVHIDGIEVFTNNKGIATARVAVGPAKIQVSKKYFNSAEKTVTVPIFKQKDVPQLRLQATGRQVSVKVTNKISKRPLANATLVAAGTEAKTDTDGTATLVVPAGEDKVPAVIKAPGFNDAAITVLVMKGESENSFALTPAGKIYFLSNQSGKLDVVKANLDGSSRQTVLSGTGREDKPNTSLLASRDWRYLALLARRDSEKPKLYLIDTQTDKVTAMDEGAADFQAIGWSDHNFVFVVNRTNMQWFDAKRAALKSYNADTQKLVTIDENASEGAGNYEWFTGTYIVDNEIVYGKRWSNDTNGHKQTLNAANADGKNKRLVKSYDLSKDGAGVNVSLRPHNAQSLYIMIESYANSTTSYAFEEYLRGQVKPSTAINENQFYNDPYTTYLVSASGDKTFWSELRDGVPVFFVGAKDGSGGEQIVSLPKFSAYGWFSNDYLLFAKDGSQLYIAPRTGLEGEADLLKVTDYYRPDRSYAGYGYGYGGV